MAQTTDEGIKYDLGGKTPLALGTQAAAVSHLGPLKGKAGSDRVTPEGDIEDLLRKWEYFLIDDDGDGNLTAEELVDFVKETEADRGAKPFLRKLEEERKQAEFQATLESLNSRLD
jgi:hypothetical protein